MTTPSEVLGVAQDATDDEIRTAYRRAAMKHHPDRGGSVEAFQAVQEAYETLLKRPCTACSGKGFVTTRRGFFTEKTPCPKCWKT